MTFTLPVRPGDKPLTDNVIPHTQYDQNSSPEIVAKLADWLFSLEHIECKHSMISVAGTPGAYIKQDVGPINQAAVMVDREFTHIHPEPNPGSQHLVLTPEDAKEVIDKGWGEEHPLLARGQIRTHTIMVYAPRNEEDLKTIKTITKRAYDYALSKLQ
ncbi:luciferase domain-containing protein [Thalassotalea fusca]